MSTNKTSRKRLLLVSAAVAAVAGSVAAGTALAAGPALPAVSAESLLARALNSHTQTFTGTVQSTVDLGLPSQLVSQLPSALASAGGKGGPAGSAAADPQSQQAEQQLLSLLSGTHSFDLAVDGQNRQSFSSSDTGRTVRFVHNGTEAWTYDSQTNQAVQYTNISPDEAKTQPSAPAMTTPADAARLLQQIAPFSSVRVDGDSMVAGRQVYVLVVSPKGNGSTVGDVRLSVDAKTFMPLGVQVDPSDGGSPIADVRFTSVSYAPPAASTFDFTLPQGAKLTTRSVADLGHGTAGKPGKPAESKAPQGGQHPNANDVQLLGSGWTTVYKLSPAAGAKGGKSGSPLSELGALQDLGHAVPGGTLFTTKAFNVLVTSNGTVYAGAVTPAYLENLAK
ncbi:outer membrane lipoprotein-sorting protein [Streptacidiphilus sp. MAP12-33]|uniref:LolA family protein n=1 Tax=Streptacidiphilus sp. MAP12-33 TaxID=3156266 RepID=UPI0035156236